jgi:hypothetical protein
MLQIDFTEKRTFVSDFSTDEMILIANTSKSAARKYFVTKYIIPLVMTIWYQRENIDHAQCVVRLIPHSSGFVPHFAFEAPSYSMGKSAANLANDALLLPELPSVFKACPPSAWGSEAPALQQAIKNAFDECFPPDFVSPPQATLGQFPLICSLERHTSATGMVVTLHNMIKTRQSVRDPSALLLQAEKKTSPLIMRSSKKYRKMYNTITGDWHGVCNRNDPPEEICAECAVIYASLAANNAYDDPEFS